MRKPKQLFLTDSMLAKLCRWLRILGFQCVSASEIASKLTASKQKPPKSKNWPAEIDDEVLLKQCLKLEAILLTRDEALAHKAGNYVKTLLIKSNDLEEQVASVAKAFSLKLPAKPKQALCTHCGSALFKIKKESVRGKIFPRVFEKQKNFWKCPSCGSLYWQGTHWEKIVEREKKMREAVTTMNK